jgi:hypothetical protein
VPSHTSRRRRSRSLPAWRRPGWHPFARDPESRSTPTLQKAKREMRGWPVATIAFYGPNLSRATKVVVGTNVGRKLEASKMLSKSAEFESHSLRQDPNPKKSEDIYKSKLFHQVRCDFSAFHRPEQSGTIHEQNVGTDVRRRRDPWCPWLFIVSHRSRSRTLKSACMPTEAASICK